MTTHTNSRVTQHSTQGFVAVGTTIFAGVMLATVAIFQILQGIAAIGKDEVFVSGVEYVYKFDISTWGWIHLVIGIIGLATAVGILLGQAWGFIAGIAIAAAGAVTNFAFLPFYPFWSIAILAFNAFVIWALCNRLTAADEI